MLRLQQLLFDYILSRFRDFQPPLVINSGLLLIFSGEAHYPGPVAPAHSPRGLSGALHDLAGTTAMIRPEPGPRDQKQSRQRVTKSRVITLMFVNIFLMFIDKYNSFCIK